VGVTNSARRERATFGSAGLQQRHMPIVDLPGPELLQSGRAKVWDDLLLGELPVAL
jgi:hypothetical protein